MTDLEHAVRVLAEAFANDPMAEWLFPNAPSRRRALPRVFRPLVESSAAAGELASSPNNDAVAVWLPLAAGESAMDGPPIDPVSQPHLARLVTFTEYAGPRHPTDQAHLYLPFIGVAHGARGNGLGGALLTERLAKADAEGCPAYLEASSARNRKLYLRHGFVDHGEPIDLPDGPRVWPMWRAVKTPTK